MIRYVGIDLHKRLLVMCILDAQGRVLLEKRLEKVDAESLLAFFQTHLLPEDQVVLEATSHVWAVVGILEKCVAKVVVSNPVTAKAIAGGPGWSCSPTWALQEVFNRSQPASIDSIFMPTLRLSMYHREGLPFQSTARETRPARTGFSCMYVSFSRSFCSL